MSLLEDATPLLVTDKSIAYGWKVTKWRGMPTGTQGNGRVRAVIFTWGEANHTMIGGLGWPIDFSKVSFSWSRYDGATVGLVHDWTFIEEVAGYVEKSNIVYYRARDGDENNWGLPGLVIEVHDYAPFHFTPIEDIFVRDCWLHNQGDAAQTFEFYIDTGLLHDRVRRCVYNSTDGYVLLDFGSGFVVFGGNVKPDACYLDDEWRTTDYETTNSQVKVKLKWNVTLDPGANMQICGLFVFDDSEANAISRFNTLKQNDWATESKREYDFWIDWWNNGKRYSTGIYEADSLAYILLPMIKSLQSRDNMSFPAGISAFYSGAHWPSDAWPAVRALIYWGHYREAMDYLAVGIKGFKDYIVENDLPLHSGIHITNLLSFQCGSGYASEAVFALIIIAGELLERYKDYTREELDNVWDWVSYFMSVLEDETINSGDWTGCHNHVKIIEDGVYESWIVMAPNSTRGNNMLIAANFIPLYYNALLKAAYIAELKGESDLAKLWRSRAREIQPKIKRFIKKDYTWMVAWGDVTGYIEHKLDMFYMFVSTWLGDIVTSELKEAIRGYWTNYQRNYYPEIASQIPINNWMLEEGEKGGNTGDMICWNPWCAYTYLGIDDAVESWLKLIKRKYDEGGHPGWFDEPGAWDGEASLDRTMLRSVGMAALGFAFIFARPKPRLIALFENKLREYGRPVVILKQRDESTDNYGNAVLNFEPYCLTKAIIKSLRGDEEVFEAGTAAVDECKFFFKSFTPVEAGDRIRVGSIDYAVESVIKHYVNDRILMKEAYARRVIE